MLKLLIMNSATTPDPVRILRISRLLKGARADLQSAKSAKDAGWKHDMHGGPIDAEIARLRENVDMWSRKLEEVGGGSDMWSES